MKQGGIEVVDSRVHPLSEFFDGLRQSRQEHRRPPGERSTCAVQTIVRDEAVMFPIWLGYYSRFFAPEDIYVLDHGSTDGSTEVGGFVRIPVEHETIENRWIVSMMQDHQRSLLERYDAVLTVDCDEIVAPDPGWGTLGDYVAGFQEDFVNCLGYEVIHLPDREPPFDPGRPVLEQRGHWFAADGYDKPALATSPTPWTMGFHSRTDGELNLDPDLRLIHLHRLDHDLCRERHRTWRSWAWHERDRNRGQGAHNRIADGPEFEHWYYNEGCFEEPAELAVERIPEPWRGVV